MEVKEKKYCVSCGGLLTNVRRKTNHYNPQTGEQEFKLSMECHNIGCKEACRNLFNGCNFGFFSNKCKMCSRDGTTLTYD